MKFKVRRFVQGTFHELYEPTIEEKFTKQACFSGISITLDIIDTSGKVE